MIVLLCLAITPVRISSITASCLQAAPSTTFPSLPTTCINHIGWHHSTENFHGQYSSLHKLCTGATGFLLDSWTLKMGPKGCPKTSVRNYLYSLCNNPEGCSSYPFWQLFIHSLKVQFVIIICRKVLILKHLNVIIVWQPSQMLMVS